MKPTAWRSDSISTRLIRELRRIVCVSAQRTHLLSMLYICHSMYDHMVVFDCGSVAVWFDVRWSGKLVMISWTYFWHEGNLASCSNLIAEGNPTQSCLPVRVALHDFHIFVSMFIMLISFVKSMFFETNLWYFVCVWWSTELQAHTERVYFLSTPTQGLVFFGCTIAVGNPTRSCLLAQVLAAEFSIFLCSMCFGFLSAVKSSKSASICQKQT